MKEIYTREIFVLHDDDLAVKRPQLVEIAKCKDGYAVLKVI